MFSYLVACVWLVFPQSIIAVKLVQVLLHAATVFIAYKTVYEILRKEIPAFFGASVVALNPLLAAYGRFLHRTVAYVSLHFGDVFTRQISAK
jgi:hypothetical protein